MNCLTRMLLSTALVALPFILPTDANAASDRKVDHGMNCQPLSPQSNLSDLYYRPTGLKNIRTTPEYIVCSLSVDADGVSNWSSTGGSTAYIDVTFQTPHASTPYCEVSVGSPLDGTKATFSGSTVMTAGSVNNVGIVADGDTVTQNFMINYPVSLYCIMPPESTILRIRTTENTTTDVP